MLLNAKKYLNFYIISFLFEYVITVYRFFQVSNFGFYIHDEDSSIEKHVD